MISLSNGLKKKAGKMALMRINELGLETYNYFSSAFLLKESFLCLHDYIYRENVINKLSAARDLFLANLF
jgi:hypothetical protein